MFPFNTTFSICPISSRPQISLFSISLVFLNFLVSSFLGKRKQGMAVASVLWFVSITSLMWMVNYQIFVLPSRGELMLPTAWVYNFARRGKHMPPFCGARKAWSIKWQASYFLTLKCKQLCHPNLNWSQHQVLCDKNNLCLSVEASQSVVRVLVFEHRWCWTEEDS